MGRGREEGGMMMMMMKMDLKMRREGKWVRGREIACLLACLRTYLLYTLATLRILSIYLSTLPC